MLPAFPIPSSSFLFKSGGEGVRPPKAPKNPRLGDSDGPPQSSEWDSLCLPEESEGRSGPIPSVAWNIPASLPTNSGHSTNSARRFVPQFAKPKKTVTRQAELREEDLGDGAPTISQVSPQTQLLGPALAAEFNLGFLWHWLDLHVSQPGSQLQEESLGLAPWEAGKLGAQTQVDSTHPDSDAEEESDQGALQEAGAQGGAEAALPERHQEEGDSVLDPITQGPEPRSAAQGLSDPMQIPRKAGREAEESCSSPRHSSLGTVAITDVSANPTELEHRAPEVARPDEQAPDGGCSGTLLSCTPLTGETRCGGEAGWEDKPPGNILGGPAASLALDHRIREATIGAGDSSLLASEMGAGVDQTKVTGLDQEGQGDVCVLPLLLQPTGKKVAELDHQSPEQDLEGFSLSLGAFAPPVHREAVDGPSQETRAFQGSIDASVDPTGWSEPPPGSADQDVLGKSPTMEPDFLPDSQIQDALEAPDFEASPVQVRASPRYGRPFQDRCQVAMSLSQTTQTRVGIKACEAARLEDATDTVQGLVVELSSLNRLVMSTHRDLEAFKRLSYRKARLAGKAPAPYTSKGAGNLPPGERSWRDL
uniref:Uncharacterized protein n=1 Tax=Ursus americanus TaxID=9643 RepID=A0A452QQX6_URSAM